MKSGAYKVRARETLLGHYGVLIGAALFSWGLLFLLFVLAAAALLICVAGSEPVLFLLEHGLRGSISGGGSLVGPSFLFFYGKEAAGAAMQAAGAIGFTACLFFGFLLVFLLGMGQIKMAMKLCRRQRVRFRDLFYGFRGGAHPLRFFFAVLLLTLLNLLLLGLSFALAWGGARAVGAFMGMAMTESGTELLFCLFYVLLSLFLLYPLCFAPLVLIDRPEQGLAEAFRISRRNLKGRVLRLFWLDTFSFLLWELLVYLSFGIAGLWVYPYMTCTMILYYLDGLGALPGDSAPAQEPYAPFGAFPHPAEEETAIPVSAPEHPASSESDSDHGIS